MCIKTINFIIKLFLRPIAGCNLISKNVALHIPAVGKISLLLRTGQRLFMENEGRDAVANSIYWLGIKGYEPESTKIWVELARKSKVIFDIGAYTGLYSLLAALVNSKAKVFAFEPIDAHYNHLKRNIEINNFDNIVPVKKIVSDKVGINKLKIPYGSLLQGSASIIDKFDRKDIEEELLIDSITIDFFIKEKNIKVVDLVKIDVEAAEPIVLKGMCETIQNYYPTFIIEVLPHKRVETFLQEFFQSYGYTGYWLTDKGQIKKEVVKGDTTYRFSNYLFSKDDLHY
jgi:FkbM family methyltransferase